MVEKQLRQKTQILTVELVVDSIHFKHRDCPFPVNFFPGWLAMLTEGDVLEIGALEPNILEAVFTYPEHRLFAILLRIWGEVPGVDLKFAYHDQVYILDLGESMMFFLQCSGCWVHLIEVLRIKPNTHRYKINVQG